MINFYHYLNENKNLANLNNSLFFFFPDKNQQLKNKYFKVFNSVGTYYQEDVVKDNIYIATNGFKKDVFFRKNVKLYRKINSYLHNATLNKTRQYFVSLYTKDDLIRPVFILKFNPKKYLRLAQIKYKQKQLLLKRCLYILFKNKKGIDNTKFSYRKLKWNKKISIFTGNTYIFKRIKNQKQYFISENGFLLVHQWRKISKKSYPGIYFILDIDTKKYFHRISILLHLLLKFFGKIFIKEIKNSVKLFFTMFVYFKFYNYLSQEIQNNIKQQKIKFRRKKNKIMRRYTRFFRKIYNGVLFFLFKLYKKKFMSKLTHDLEINWSNWFFYSKRFNNVVWFSDDVDDNRKILRAIKHYSTTSKIEIFKHLIYLLQLNVLTRIDILKTNIQECYYDLKSKLFYSFLNKVLYKKLLIHKTSCLNFFSCDLYLLSFFKYHKLEYVFNIHHGKIYKRMYKKKVNEFINANNFCWRFYYNKRIKVPGLLVMKQLYYKKRKVNYKRFYKKYWLKTVLIPSKNYN